MYARMSGYMRTIVTVDANSLRIVLSNSERNANVTAFNIVLCSYCLTCYGVCVTVILMTTSAKKKALLASGTLNPHPEVVQSDLFKMDFFDPCDRAQVKYEMLRAHSVDGDPVSEVCRQFGFSRESFYQIQQAFSQLGFSSLLPAKRGRKGPVKLKGEVLEFALEKKREDRDLDPGRLAALIRERYGTDIHRTTVMRGVKKKRCSSAERPTRGIRRRRRPGAGPL